MHSTIYGAFRDIVSKMNIAGRILEIGAVPAENTLLNLDVLRDQERIGVNIEKPSRFNGFDIVQMSGNDLSIFPSGHFDCVLSNATIEHEKHFWKICAEIHRVLRPGGVAIIGAPGYSHDCDVARLGLSRPEGGETLAEWPVISLIYQYHAAPKDYYRFSADAFREVIFDGYGNVEVLTIMVPPRLIGYGIKLDAPAERHDQDPVRSRT